MTYLLAQTTQPAEWVWTNISPEKLALWIAIWGAAATALVIGIFKLINLFIEQYWGSKALWKKKMEEAQAEQARQIKALSIVSDASSVPATEEAKQTVNAAAQAPTIDIGAKNP